MFKRIATALWGHFESGEELKKFLWLATIFGFIIGTYWVMRPMKDGVFAAIVGVDFLPWAKMLSLVAVVPLVILYSKLIDMFPRQKVFYVLIAIYSLLALLFVYLLLNPTFGLANTVENPGRMLGWLWYIYIESFGSLVVALFWAFTTDTTLPDSAKRGFPIIALFGQIGNMVGPFFLNAKRLGFATSAPVLGICAGLMLFTGFLFWLMMRTVSKAQFSSYEAPEAKEEAGEPGFFEGLKLLLTQRYLLGIFMIVSIYEIIVTVLDFHFKVTAKSLFTSEAAMSSYLSQYASMVGLVSMLCVLLGINNIQRKLGMKTSLFLLPILIGGAVLMVKFNPTGLAVAFWIMVFAKAVNYALNQPTLKQLYIPTTKETKYKSQAWIEMFGSRGSKASGSAINTLRGSFTAKYGSIIGVNAFLTLSTLLSGGFILIWFFAALYISDTYNKAIDKNEVIC
jgi:AAA family ATP:ADP antiporter